MCHNEKPDQDRDVTAMPNMNTTAINVRVEGTCPNGHQVFHNLPVNAVNGSHGWATASTDCPSCGGPVAMSGHYTT